MALPPGITPKTVTIGLASFFDGTLSDGTVSITAPVNVVHTPTNRPLFSSVMTQKFVDGAASFTLCPTDDSGLNRVDWTYKLNVNVSGALVQPDPIYFTLPAAGPDTVDLDGLVTVPSSAGTPISVSAITVADIGTPTSTAALALRAVFVPKWKPNTAYTAGEPVLNPSGQTVTANTSFTSGATYSASNWTIVPGGVSSVAGRTGAVTLASTDLTDSAATGQALVAAATAAAGRTTLGLGSAATQPSSAFDTAGAAALRAPLLVPTATKTATYTAAAGDLAMMNVAGGATALTLPTAPADKAQVGYRAIGATTAVPLTVNRGGSDTIGTAGATNTTVALADEVVVLQYDAPNTRWLAVSAVKTQASLDARYVATANAAPLAGGADPLPAAPGTAARGASGKVADELHVHPSAGLFADYGDGSDGAVTFDGTTTPTGNFATGTFTRSGSVYTLNRGMNLSSLTLAAGVTVLTSGFRLNINGPLIGPTGGTPAVIQGPTGNATTSTAAGFSGNGNSGLGVGGKGPAGGTGVGAAGVAGGGGWPTASGGGGGAGGTAGATAGGAASTTPGMAGSGLPVNPLLANNVPFGLQFLRSRHGSFTGQGSSQDVNNPGNVRPSIVAGGSSGGAGAGDGTNAGGAGGWGGSVVIVSARAVSGNITVTAPGGTGGAGAAGNAAGGGGGGGGVAILNTADSTGFTGTVTAPGGTGGAGAGTGVAGTAGGAGIGLLQVWSAL